MITLNKDRKQTKYGHKRQEHMTHTTEDWHSVVQLIKKNLHLLFTLVAEVVSNEVKLLRYCT